MVTPDYPNSGEPCESCVGGVFGDASEGTCERRGFFGAFGGEGTDEEIYT